MRKDFGVIMVLTLLGKPKPLESLDVREQCIHPAISISGEIGKEQLSKRIVGGEFFEAGEWPFLVSLRFKMPSEVAESHSILKAIFSALYVEKAPRNFVYMHVCAGTLIHPQFVLSALHCFEATEDYTFLTMDAKDWVVKVGEHHLINPEDHETEIQVGKIITHLPNGRTTIDGGDDIILLKLSQPVSFDYWAKPVCLPSPGLPEPKSGAPCIAAGWGREAEGKVLHTLVPKHVEVPFFNKTQCNFIYSSVNLPLDSDMLCAGGEESGRGPCQFDSGGPLICKDGSAVWNYIGIVSFGIGCGDAAFPGVYTSVVKHLDWVEQAMVAELA